MKNYFRKAEYVLDDVYFEYLGGCYHGRGLLTWNPEAGFHLEAFVQRQGPPVPSPLVLGRLRVIDREDRKTIRMRIQHGGRAIARVILADRLDLLHQNRLSIRPSRVCFSSRVGSFAKKHAPKSSALLAIGDAIHWPNVVKTTVQLNERVVQEADSAAGLEFDEPHRKGLGLLQDDQYLELYTTFSTPPYNKRDAWRWPEAVATALALMIGRAIPLLERTALSFPHEHLERRRLEESISIKPFDLFEEDGRRLDKQRLLTLADLFLRGGRNARICRSIFDQLRRASQTSWVDTELLVSTVLEGTLRAVYRIPYKDRSWDPAQSLSRFRQEYLGSSWRPVCNRVSQIFRQLRHRRAHPDWLADESGPSHDQERQTSLTDMIFLCHFYGYVVLALAGVKNLEPVFGGRSVRPTSD